MRRQTLFYLTTKKACGTLHEHSVPYSDLAYCQGLKSLLWGVLQVEIPSPLTWLEVEVVW